MGKSGLARPTHSVPASRLGQAIVWLRDRGVSAEHLASVLGTTGLNIRQIDYRERRRPDQTDLRQPQPSTRALGIRRDEDAAPASRRRDTHIGAVRERIETIRSAHVADGRYSAAASLLKQLHSYQGFPSNIDWLRLAGHLHRERAWFLVHSGQTAQALEQAAVAIAIGKRVYRMAQKSTSADAKDVVDAALIQAHAHLMRREPEAAFAALQLVEDASEAANLQLGSDYYRQRGVVLLQAGLNAPAIRYFRKSGERMIELGEGSHPLSASITSHRYVSLLTGSVDSAAELASLASDAFGASSMEASVSTNFAAASALSVDSHAAELSASELLARNRNTSAQFGHQATLTRLLTITPSLNLPLPIRRDWIRQALYINATARR